MYIFLTFFSVLDCLQSGEECVNGGRCIQRPLGDYVCSCPYPYCGTRCQSQRPSCGSILNKILFKLFECISFL